MSGTVCGQDPRYCKEPPSRYPYEWPDDITQWPVSSLKPYNLIHVSKLLLYCHLLSLKVCRSSNPPKIRSTESPHMTCDVIGRPCCIGIQGECRITTREYCDFVSGFFHSEASLCSQVSCMSDVCGMMSFWTDNEPNQFYRLWTPIFLHGG